MGEGVNSSGGGVRAGEVAMLGGAMATQAHLLDELSALVRADAEDIDLLATPIRVIVPSRSLREHLTARLVDHQGRAVAGVVIHTFHTLILSILDRNREPAIADEKLFTVLVRQLGRSEPALRESLEPLRNGYAVVEAAVSDLLDAGFQSAHTDAVLEQIDELGHGFHAERAAAVVRVAAAVCEQLEVVPVGHRSAWVRRAEELLDADPDGVLPARAIFVFGFADATGVQTDFIETLLRRCGARIYIDQPPDPDELTRPDPGISFSARFSARLLGVTGDSVGRVTGDSVAGNLRFPALASGAGRGRVTGDSVSEHPEPPEIVVLHAPGREAEVRAVAEQIRTALDDGVRPERIGVVARSFDGYRAMLRVHFGRLGIPVSGIGERGPAGPEARRIASLQKLLRTGARTSVDLWLELLSGLPKAAGKPSAPLTSTRRADLRLAFHTAGVARLDGVSKMSIDSLSTALDSALGLVEFLSNWPKRGPLETHFDALRTLLAVHLRWGAEGFQALELGALTNSDFILDREDFLLYLERALSQLGSVPIGGLGGGVALLSAMEARSRTFDRLFIIGLNREVFPRPIAEDSLLPDALRRSLRAVLPDLPVKREGVDEDRYLFAQLLSSSPDVVISCANTDESGRVNPASPLLDRLRSGSHSTVPGLLAPSGTNSIRPRTAHESALIAGLHGTRKQFEGALQVALDEAGSREAFAAAKSDGCAQARAAIVAELDSVWIRHNELGPYFGFLGEIAADSDPRHAPISITRLEALAACPWQMFLRHFLRIKPLPDTQALLPGLDPTLTGQLVHRVLEEIAAAHLPAANEPLSVVVHRDPTAIPWPRAAKLDELLNHWAKALLLESGISTPGFERLLVDHARGFLEIARCNEWPGPGAEAGVLGVEVKGAATIYDRAGTEREIRFRADRVDAVSGGLRLVDYKTGKPVSEKKKESTRSDALRKGMGQGKWLQAAVYALGAARCTSASAVGQYLNLSPLTADEARVAEVDSENHDFIAAFESAASTVLDALDCGSFFPRLIEQSSGSEPRQCQFCDVKEACRRGDSGARRTLEHWADAAAKADGEPQSAAENAALRLWNLGMAKP